MVSSQGSGAGKMESYGSLFIIGASFTMIQTISNPWASSPGALASRLERKESMQLRLWNLKIYIEKVDAKRWLAEMTLIMASLPLAHVLFNVCLHSCSFPLRIDWRKSESSVDGEPQGNWKLNSNSRDVAASSPPPLPPMLPERRWELAPRRNYLRSFNLYLIGIILQWSLASFRWR